MKANMQMDLPSHNTVKFNDTITSNYVLSTTFTTNPHLYCICGLLPSRKERMLFQLAQQLQVLILQHSKPAAEFFIPVVAGRLWRQYVKTVPSQGPWTC
jgi:hypothetical protein